MSHLASSYFLISFGAKINSSFAFRITENKPLARLMYRYGRVGAEIPAQLYVAVAEVLAWVYRTNRYRYYMEENRIGGSVRAAQ
jgi:flagellar biosynthesis protein FlhB